MCLTGVAVLLSMMNDYFCFLHVCCNSGDSMMVWIAFNMQLLSYSPAIVINMYLSHYGLWIICIPFFTVALLYGIIISVWL